MPGKRVQTHKKKKLSRTNRKQKAKILNATVAEKWNKQLTTADNFKILGLAKNANDVLPISYRFSKPVSKNEDEVKDSSLLEEWSTIDSEKNITGHGSARRTANWLSDEDVEYLGPLFEKYGTDYDSMFRDVKLNCYQHPKGWLKRKIEKYIKFKSP